MAAESDRAYQGGPRERTFCQEASLTPEEGGADFDLAGFQLPNQYTSPLDWFAVDVEGEHSAMDGGILRSGIPQSFNWMMQSHLASQEPKHVLVKDVKDAAGIVLHLS